MKGKLARLASGLCVALACAAALLPGVAHAAGTNMSEQDLRDMVAAAGAGEVVTLTGDVELTSSLQINKQITLDLAGHAIGYNSTLNGADAALKVSGSGVCVRGGAIESNNVAISVSGDGEFTLSGCTVATSSATKDVIEIARSFTEGAVARIEDSTITAGASGIAITKSFQDAGSDLHLAGNTRVEGRVKCVFTATGGNGSVRVDGGFYNSGDKQCFFNGNPNAGDAELAKHLVISSGQFTTAPRQEFVDPGSACVEGAGDYPFVVAPSGQTGVAYTTGEDGARTFYDTVEQAVEAANGAPVTIARTCAVSDAGALNGANLKGSTGAWLTVDGGLNQVVATVASMENLNLICADAKLSVACASQGGLTAGTFSSMPTDAVLGFVADGYLLSDENLSISSEDKFEARIGKIGYALLISAVTDATQNDATSQNSETIVLLKDVPSKSAGLEILFPKSAFVLDLNGKTIAAGKGNPAVMVSFLKGSATGPDGARITIKNGSLKGDTFGIATNGALKDVTLNLENVDVTANEQAGVAAYLASGGSTIIKGGSYRGAVGIQLCAGSLVVDGARVTATAPAAPKVESDGPILDGAAVSIVDRTGYGQISSVEIKGGTFESLEGMPSIKAYHFDNEDKAEEVWREAGDAVEVTGGSFSFVPDNMQELLGSGYGGAILEDGSLVVHMHQIQHAPATDSTCLKQGHIEHWWCPVEGCGKFYADADAKHELTLEQILKPLSEHALKRVAEKRPTATQDGVREHWKCGVCGKLFLDAKGQQETDAAGVVVPATGEVEPGVTMHRVTFVFGNGDANAVVKVEDGGKVKAPANPSRDGWKFVGWFTVKNSNGTLSGEWDFSSDVVEGDLVLYGGWVKDGSSAETPFQPSTPLPQTSDLSLFAVAATSVAGVTSLAGAAMRRRTEK